MINIPFLPKDDVIVYLDGHSLKIAVAKEQAGIRTVHGLYYRDTSGLKEEDVASEITQGLHALNFSNKEVRVLISSSYAITKSAEIPSFDDAEIQAIVSLQASRHTPYAKEEIITSHLNLEQVYDRFTKTLITILPKQGMNKALEILKQQGLKIKSVNVSFEAVGAGLNKAHVFNMNDTVVVVAIDMQHTDFMVVHNQKTIFVRSIPIGLSHLKESHENSEFISEIKKSLEGYQAEGDVAVTKAVVLGPNTTRIQEIAAEIGTNLDLGLQVIHGADQVNLSSEAQQQAKEYSHIALDNIMLASAAANDVEMDFLPEDLLTERRFRDRANQMVTAGTLLLTIFATFIGIFITKAYFQNAYIKSLDKNFASRNAQAEQLIVVSDQNRTIQDLKNRKGSVLAALTELENIMPRQMYLNEFTIDSDGKVLIKGTSELMSRVFAFVTEYENSDRFQNVTTDYAKSRKVNGEDVTDFGLSAMIQEGS